MHTLLFILSILAAAGQPEFPSIEPALARAYAGSYQLSRDRIIDIGPMDEVGGDLIFLDHATLRTGRLRVMSENELIAGPTLGSDSPISIKARFLRDRKGEVAALYWNGERARKIAPRTDELVRIRRDGIVLEGVLNRPAGRGPHPAIVLAHGSGDSTRNVGFWNMFFVRQGFAVLSLDKRGAGSSTGDWKKASLEDIADDWLAGVNYLKGRPDIDVRRIGVHGSSQGGWTGPLMAAKSRDIAFLIVRAGSGMNLVDTMVHEIEWTVKEKGFSNAEASAGARAAREAFELTARGASWDEFESG
ncbi:MAG TPA: alpha/beta fold hydrolase [Thermoanaerobaculia bacterium]|nr:alpha/beta fold hydrolase [Thermoanaerobaculia bacterium]